MGLVDEGWLLLALFAMACFSVSAILLKVLVTEHGLPRLWQEVTRPALSAPVQLALGIAVLSLVGFGAFLTALQTGKVALVNAVAGLSTVLIALLSYAFLGDRFALKEIAAMVLALASILVLAL
jgi:drug/metabolite transporter (DMT)-like permease